VSEDYADPAGESEMRRRAAWLLGMLVLVAVLLVGLMVFFLKGGGHSSGSPSGPPLPTGPASTPHSQSSTPSSPTTSTSASTNSSSASTRPHSVHCPTDQTCVAQGDAGGLLAAINAYRREHGQAAVSGSVSNAAQTCALTNGGQCTGSWAESEVPAPGGAPNGEQALQKIIPLSHDLLAPNLSGLEVGWAYDPGARLCYFAVITDS
jgi:hypothetical protein